MFRPGLPLGEFDLIEPIIEDAVTAVWRARRRATGELCTLEALSAELARQKPVRDAFVNAARTTATATLDRRIARVLEVGQDESSDVPFIATEDDVGPSLAARLRARGALPAPDVATIVRQLRDVLPTLHARGLAHGDLSPRNLVLAEQSGQELSLRGFARGAVLGLLDDGYRAQVAPHAPPEQRGTGVAPTSSTDVHGLAVLALALLTGDDPGRAWATTSVPGAAVVTPRPSGVSPTWATLLPAGFDEWFAECVAPQAVQRPAFADAAQKLGELLAGRPAPRVEPQPHVAPPPVWGPPATGAPTRAPFAPTPFGAPAPTTPFGAPATPAEGATRTARTQDKSFYVVLAVIGVLAVGVVGMVVVAAAAAAVVYFRTVPGKGTTGPTVVAEAPTSHATAAIPVLAEDPTWGAADAPVTVVVFSDFQCPFCSRVTKTLEQVRQEFGPTQVRLVWKHNPLPFHKQALPAHEASVAVHLVGGDEAFWTFHDRAFDQQKDLTDAHFAEWATAAGIPSDRYREALAGPRPAEKVAADMKLAKEVGVRGVPAFRINGIELSGAQPFQKFAETIKAELTAAEQAIARGTPRGQVYVERVAANFKQAAPTTTTTAKPTEDDRTIWHVPVHADDPRRGPEDALVTIVQWSEFQCPFCKRVAPTLDEVLAEHPADVRLVWKDNPLPVHARAKPAAVLARVAYRQGGDAGFWRAHDALFASAPQLEDDDLSTVAATLGLSWSAVGRALASGEYDRKLGQSSEEASERNARGTPSFFINGFVVTGAQPKAKFETVIEERLREAKALVATGVPRSDVYTRIMRDAKRPPGPEVKVLPAPTADNPWRGSANARVVIQVFSEFQCPFCARYRPTLDELERKYPGQLKIVWRHLPLTFHQDAQLAAEASHEAFVQRGNSGFWRFHDALFDAQREPDGLKRPALERLAAAQGLDLGRFRRALDDRTHERAVKADVAIAEQAGITGTPASVVGRYFVSGAQPITAVAKLVDKTLADL